MSMFCNGIRLLLLYVHVCVTRTGWKTRPGHNTVILSLKKERRKEINQISLFLFLCLYTSVCQTMGPLGRHF